MSLLASIFLVISAVTQLVSVMARKIKQIASVMLSLLVFYIAIQALCNEENMASLKESIALLIVLYLIAVVFLVDAFFSIISYRCLAAYQSLKISCQCDYDYLNITGKSIVNDILCFAYTILRLLVFVISRLFQFLLSIGCIGIVVFAITTVRELNRTYQTAYGMSVFGYLKTLPMNEVITEVSLPILVIIAVAVVVIMITMELTEWGVNLANGTIGSYDDITGKNYDSITLDDPNVSYYWEMLKPHVEQLDILVDSVNSVLEMKEDAVLRVKLSEYLNSLRTIVDTIKSNGDRVVLDKSFTKQFDAIQKLDGMRMKILEMVDKLREELENPVASSKYFKGCETKEQLSKRYKQLCKELHPDSGGDTDLFQEMQTEYNRLKDCNFTGTTA